jgi:hypothetical protein
LTEKGDYKKAYEILSPLKNRLDLTSRKMLHDLAYRNQAWQEAIAIGNKLFIENSDYKIAFVNALCYAILGQPKPAVSWLKAAVRQGMPHLKIMLSKEEFDKIRNSSFFQDFILTQF